MALVSVGIWNVARKAQDASSMPVEVVVPTPAPADGVPVTGPSGWRLLVAPAWNSVDVSSPGVEGGWLTGSGTAAFHDNVNVFTEKPKVDLDLGTYVRFSAEKAPSQIPDVVILSSHLYSDGAHQFARLEYTGTVNGRALHFLGYVVKVQARFVVVTYTAPADTFTSTLPAVEAYLVTLGAQ